MTVTPPSSSTDINRVLRGASREIRTLLLVAHKQKFTVAPTRNNHYSVSTPPGVRPRSTVFTPKTPSDTKGLHRVVRKLRHIGVEIPHN